MPKLPLSSCAIVSLGAVVAGCQTAPARYAGEGAHVTYAAAATGASAIKTTGGELYVGAGRAVRAPFRDLNMMQDKIAPVLLRAEARPYDLVGVNSCADVLNHVSELDLALGPDVDTPKEQKKRTRRGADFAANAALDAAGSAVEHFIPMRGTIKQISGATRYENHVRHAMLAGATRRSFLKAVGMAHNCSWPAAPLDFKPTQVADVDAAWTAGSSATMLASAPAAQQAPVIAAPAVLAASGTPAPAPVQPRVVMVSAASASRPGTPVFVPIQDQLSIPSAAPPEMTASQSWRPAPRMTAGARVEEVSAPLTTTAALSPSSASRTSAPAPWSSSFASAAPAARP
jgi:hypothetical protein